MSELVIAVGKQCHVRVISPAHQKPGEILETRYEEEQKSMSKDEKQPGVLFLFDMCISKTHRFP